MKHIFLNLKRFDVPVCYGGVNRIAEMKDWGSYIVANTQESLKKYDPSEVEFVQYLPEAHLLNAVAAQCENSPVQVGCQGVYRMNTAVGGNFGAFTTNRPVSAMKAIFRLFCVHCRHWLPAAGRSWMRTFGLWRSWILLLRRVVWRL